MTGHCPLEDDQGYAEGKGGKILNQLKGLELACPTGCWEGPLGGVCSATVVKVTFSHLATVCIRFGLLACVAGGPRRFR